MSLLGSFDALVERVMRRVDYAIPRSARVVQQRADGTLDLQPDDPRVPAPQSVPYLTLPGMRFTVAPGTRVLLGFVGASPAQPRALLWDIGDVTGITINSGVKNVARDGDSVSVTIPTGAVLVESPGGPVTNPAPITLTGTITSGSTVLKLP